MNTTTTTRARGATNTARLAHLSALLSEHESTRRALYALPHSTDTEQAIRAERLAVVWARIAGVWRLIAAYAITDPTVPWVFRHAAVIAGCEARDDARFWRDLASDWRARAERRPTSDAAGALSNWAELGVTV
jgi:hypothetical protein